MIKKPELKPCPFCGGEAEVGKTGKWNVFCKDLKCFGIQVGHNTEEQAIKAWNTRANDQEMKKMAEALEFAKKKREFEGTPKMVVDQMENALNEISKVAEQALNQFKDKGE